MPPAFVSRNGIILPAAEAAISVFNPAIYGAYGVYESLQVVNHFPFELQAHLGRLAHSAQVIDLALPAPLDTISAWIRDVVAAEQAPSATVRLFVVGPDNGGEACAFIWTQPPASYPQGYYREGAPVITFEGRRYLPQAKSLNTLASFLAQRRARAVGVHEALLYHAGRLTEGSNSNLFAVIGGALVTPPADEVLSGVTRDIVLRLARQDGMVVKEEPLLLDELYRWEECFITSTSRHVMPVNIVDGRQIGSGAPGPVTRRASSLLETYFAEHTSR